MPICQYYLQGNCRFGDSCFNQHIDPSSQSSSGGRKPLVQPSRFGSSPGGGLGASTGGFSFKQALQNAPSGGSFQSPSFAGQSSAPNPFGGSPAGGTFASANTFGATSSGSSFSFKSAMNQVQQQGSFGQPASFSQPSSLFGQSTPSIFGGQAGMNQQQQQPQQQQTSLFAQPTSPSFGSSATFSSPFSSGFAQSAFGQSVQPASGFNQTAPVFGASAFGGAASFSNPLAQQNPLSGQTVQPASASSLFQGTTSAPTFGQKATFESPVQGSSIFGQTIGGQSASVMTEGLPQQQQQAQQPSAASLFSTPTQALFGNPSASSSSSLFGGQPAVTADNPNDCYSEMNALSPEEIAAFQSESFVFGKIPLIPPPIELCI